MSLIRFLPGVVALLLIGCGGPIQTPTDGNGVKPEVSKDAPQDVKQFIQELESTPAAERGPKIQANHELVDRILQSTDEGTNNKLRQLITEAQAVATQK